MTSDQNGKARLVTRRALVAAAGFTLASPAILRAQGSLLATPTPAQTEGPFYPVSEPADSDNDLVVLRGQPSRALGIVTHIRGRVLGRDGRPLAGTTIEIWQCDANGRYRHPRDRAGGRDGNFQGFGRAAVASDGSYGFRTIRPVAYPGRTPHIHFRVNAPAGRLTTQMYVAGEPQNERDGLWRSLGRAGQAAVTVRLDAANGIEDGALAGTFDIIV